MCIKSISNTTKYKQIQFLEVTLLLYQSINHFIKKVETYIHDLIINEPQMKILVVLIGWLVGFYGIPTFVRYLMPNLFLYK